MLALPISSCADPVHGVAELYATAERGHQGILLNEFYLEAETKLFKSLKAVGSLYQEPFVELPSWRGYGYTPYGAAYTYQDGDYKNPVLGLDETFLAYDFGGLVARAGRLRSAFGFSNWSEQHYTPIIAPPLIRSYGSQIAEGLSLDRVDRGLDFSFGTPALQFKGGVVDTDYQPWELAPSNLDTAVGRLQASYGPFMLGLSGLKKFAGQNAAEQSMVGMDLRWTAPRIQVRGELVSGATEEGGARGYYLDLYYRPVGLARTQVGARFQGLTSIASGSHGQQMTLGIRQFVGSLFTLDVNYGFGADIPEAATALGWSAQVLTAYRF